MFLSVSRILMCVFCFKFHLYSQYNFGWSSRQFQLGCFNSVVLQSHLGVVFRGLDVVDRIWVHCGIVRSSKRCGVVAGLVQVIWRLGVVGRSSKRCGVVGRSSTSCGVVAGLVEVIGRFGVVRTRRTSLDRVHTLTPAVVTLSRNRASKFVTERRRKRQLAAKMTDDDLTCGWRKRRSQLNPRTRRYSSANLLEKTGVIRRTELRPSRRATCSRLMLLSSVSVVAKFWPN